MERHILWGSYWLGVICVLLAFLTRFLILLGVPAAFMRASGYVVSYRSFEDAALLFLLTAMASAGFIWFKKQGR
jgi:hypothetical protein